MPDKAKVYFVDRNVHGAYVVYGSEGVKQYYGYTKSQAVEKYRQDGRTFINRRAKNAK